MPEEIIVHAMILDLMFATSIIQAWKTIPKNIHIQKDKTVHDGGQCKRNIQSLCCNQDNYSSSSYLGNSKKE